MMRAKPWFDLRHAPRGSTPTSEVLEFGALAGALSWAPHVALAVSRRPYAIDDRRSAILYGIGLAGPSAAAFAVEGRHRGARGNANSCIKPIRGVFNHCVRSQPLARSRF